MWFAGQIELMPLIERNCLHEALPAFNDQRTVRKHSTIYTPDDDSDFVCLLKSGNVRLYRLTEEGQEVTLSFIKPGMIFGDGDVLNEAKYTHFAETLTPSVVCYVRRAIFRDLLSRYEVINDFVLSSHYRRWKEAQQLIENLSLHDVRKRLTNILVMFASQIGRQFSHDAEADAILIDLSIPQDKIAEFIGTSRESVNRHFNDLRAEGFVDLHQRKVVLTASFIQRYLPAYVAQEEDPLTYGTRMPGAGRSEGVAVEGRVFVGPRHAKTGSHATGVAVTRTRRVSSLCG
ncbi:MAG TPA: Crp/Fnr family transcriptional regulator [Pararobbsia sp.]|jgi:CRP/FNR family transcriptional regulator|nr:Crp/Fnr family transcriptional regulator [Pararobbsia sp.]